MDCKFRLWPISVWGGVKRDIVNSLRPAREGGGVVRGQSEFIFSPPSPPHTHTSTFTDAGNSVGRVGERGSPSSPPHTHTYPTQLQHNSCT